MILVQIGATISQFDNWLRKNLLAEAWPAQYRGMTALCEDWNDMREMYRLVLPIGQAIFGLVGPVAPQPQRSTMDPNARTTPSFRSGGEQVYFKRRADLNSVNPLWVYPVPLW